MFNMWGGSELVEGRRKSVRILALNELKRNNALSKLSDNVVGKNCRNQTRVAARTGASTSKRGRKRKRLTDVVLSSQQDGEDQQYEDDSIKHANQMQGKHIFEFIIDELQRRWDTVYYPNHSALPRSDNFDLFAQPVDPDKVPTYYTMINEPMDFGTLRAKIHEGMYTTLEQFEHDVLLISKNAMQFNAPSSVYHDQAENIEELARQLFSELKTDPGRFQLEHGLKNGRARKPRSEARGLRGRRATPSGVLRRTRRDANPRICQGLNENFPGLRDVNSNLVETQRRETYCMPSNDNESLISTVYNAPRSLVHIDGGFGYRESLSRFVQDLGPIAQMVAKRKLENLIQAPSCQSQTTPPVQSQNHLASALAALGVPGHPVGGNSGQMTQMQHKSQYNLPRDSNASYFHGDASAQGHAPTRAGICINDGAYKGKINVPVPSRLGIEDNDIDPKGKMVLQPAIGKDTYGKALLEHMAIDINKSMDIPGFTTGIGLDGSNMEGGAHQNQNSMVRLESHIRVVRDFSGSRTSNSGIKFRTVDMLDKPNNIPDQSLQQAQLSRTGSQSNQSRLLEIMARSNTYLRPSSYLPPPAPKLSSLSKAPPTTFNDFGSPLNNNYVANSSQAGQLPQMNDNYVANAAPVGQVTQLNTNYVANAAHAGQLPQWNRANTAQGLQEINSFSTPSMKLKLGEDHSALEKGGMFMRKEQELVSAAQGMLNPPLYNAAGASHERGTTQWYQNEPTSQSLLSLLEDSQQPNLALQL